MSGGVPGLIHLPVSGAVGERRGLLNINCVVRALLAALLHLHCWSEIAVDAGEQDGGFRFFNVLADLFCGCDFALNRLEAAVGVGVGDDARHAGVASGLGVRFIFFYLH